MGRGKVVIWNGTESRSGAQGNKERTEENEEEERKNRGGQRTNREVKQIVRKQRSRWISLPMMTSTSH